MNAPGFQERLRTLRHLVVYTGTNAHMSDGAPEPLPRLLHMVWGDGVR
jgi:hypothetical protein